MSFCVISLTTIPPRFAQVGRVLRSLLAQSAEISRVILWVPYCYRRFGDFEVDPALVPEGVEIRRVPVDLGPATKVLPAVRAFQGQDTRIIYCDDDREYGPDWAERLLAESDRFPGACIARTGEQVEPAVIRASFHTMKHKVLNTATIGLYGHFRREEIRALDPGSGPVDIAKGYGGVLVRPEFFPDFVHDIPGALWMVDDYWLSGCLAVAGVPIRKVSSDPGSRKLSLAEVAALIDYEYADRSRHDANLECIRYFQETYGIWKRPGVTRIGTLAVP